MFISKKKYKLTDETITYEGRVLRRIEALKDLSDVKKGDNGGFIESEFGEYTTEYKGYRIEISFDEKYNSYEADAFDLEAQEYVFYPCTKIRNTTLEHVIEVVIARIDNKIILNNRDKDILIYELNCNYEYETRTARTFT